MSRNIKLYHGQCRIMNTIFTFVSHQYIFYYQEMTLKSVHIQDSKCWEYRYSMIKLVEIMFDFGIMGVPGAPVLG